MSFVLVVVKYHAWLFLRIYTSATFLNLFLLSCTVFLVVMSHSGRNLIMSSMCGRTGKSWRLKMLVLLLCLVWNALHGIVLVRLWEGVLLSLVTMSENNHCKGFKSVNFFCHCMIRIRIRIVGTLILNFCSSAKFLKLRNQLESLVALIIHVFEVSSYAPCHYFVIDVGNYCCCWMNHNTANLHWFTVFLLQSQWLYLSFVEPSTNGTLINH